MVGREITATEIGKHSQLIKAAQEEMSTIDVLVCGRCLAVSHFIEDFEQHKLSPCSKENNNIRECNDTKPKIWAFLLWKATQLHNNKNNNNGTSTTPNSWTLYQTWVKMDESLRDTWVMAGRTIQSFSKVGQGGLQEMPVKITKTVVNNSAGGANASEGLARKPLTQTKPQLANVKTTKVPIIGTPKAAASDVENEVSPAKLPVQNCPTNALSKLIKKSPLPTANVVSPLQGKVNTVSLQSPKGPPSRRATRSTPNSEELVQENVEKIVAKRFNPRRKMHEYLVKWDGRPHEQNTWEPMSHLENVTHLLDIFEKQLARQKENRAAMQAKQGATVGTGSPLPVLKTLDGKKTIDVNKTTLSSGLKTTASGGTQFTKSMSGALTVANVAANCVAADKAEISPSTRPIRTSKMKAMDQVKQWVSSEASITVGTPGSNNEVNVNSLNSSGGSGGSANVGNTNSVALKRKFNDSADEMSDLNTSDTPSATASTMEDLEEDLIPSHTVKRMKNGTGVSVESKIVRVNGTNARGNTTTFSGESIPVGPKSAEVIITKDKGVSGVVRKPGYTGSIKGSSLKQEAQIRILSKEESAVMNTGIVRTTGGGAAIKITTSSATNSDSSPGVGATTPATTTTLVRQHQVRVGGLTNSSGGRQTPTTLNQSGRQPQQQQQILQRTASGAIIQRKPLPTVAGHQQQRTISSSSGGGTLTTTTRGGSNLTSSGGRMIVPRTGISPNTNQRSTIGGSGGSGSGSGSKAVTPEQKILQLSKSGDLKVTKKMMTREDAVAQRLSTQQQRQQQLQRQQQQSQVQIQKVQQLAPPNSTRSVSSVSVRKRADGTYTAHEEQTQSQSQLCSVTGKILGQEEQQSSQQLQAEMLTAAAAAQQQHQQQQQQQQQQLALQQQQQQQQETDQTLLLTSDQFLTNEDGTPLLVTGEDGTVYQVAGKNAEGQTILVTQGPDGEQQFAYVATAEGDENQVLSLDNAVAEAVSQLPAEQQGEAISSANQYLVRTTQEDGSTHMVTMTEAELQQHQTLMQQQITINEGGNTNSNSSSNGSAASASGANTNATTNPVAGGTGSTTGSSVNQLCIQTGDGTDGQEANIPAEVVQAELPSPGGTRRVVLLLPDGTFMMTEMQDDEFKALNIAA